MIPPDGTAEPVSRDQILRRERGQGNRETVSAVPSRVRLLMSILRLNLMLTYVIPPEFRGGVHLFIKTCIHTILVSYPSETWFRGMSVGGSFRRV